VITLVRFENMAYELLFYAGEWVEPSAIIHFVQNPQRPAKIKNNTVLKSRMLKSLFPPIFFYNDEKR
jgi:hypothetical protein